MARRTTLKWLHWLSFGIILWFFAVEPEDVDHLGGAALATHAGMGVLLSLLATVWFAIYWRKGLSSRPGPKLASWAKPLHPMSHKALSWMLPAVVLSGALAGFAAPYEISLFGMVPFFPGIGFAGLQEAMISLHEFVFDALMLLIVAHAGFHVWRHVRLRDNAMRIMAPKILHRYL